jgi:hypothetical protein
LSLFTLASIGIWVYLTETQAYGVRLASTVEVSTAVAGLSLALVYLLDQRRIRREEREEDEDRHKVVIAETKRVAEELGAIRKIIETWEAERRSKEYESEPPDDG